MKVLWEFVKLDTIEHVVHPRLRPRVHEIFPGGSIMPAVHDERFCEDDFLDDP